MLYLAYAWQDLRWCKCAAVHNSDKAGVFTHSLQPRALKTA